MVHMKTKILKLPKISVILISILIAVAYMFVSYTGAAICEALVKVEFSGQYTYHMLKEGLDAIISILVLWLLGYKFVLRHKGEGILNSIYIGGFLFFYIISGLMGNIYGYLENPPGKICSIGEIAVFTVTMFFIGVSEEVLLRGTILNLLLERFSNTRCGIWAAVVIESAIFGALHLANVRIGVELEAACWQAVNAFMIGLVFSAIYVRCKNIWIPVFLHAAYDFIALMNSGIFGQGTHVDQINNGGGANWSFYLVMLIVTVILLKKKKATQTNAVVSVLLGSFSILVSWMGMFWISGVMGILAAQTSKGKQENLSKLAKVGLVLSIIGAILGILFAVGIISCLLYL